MALSNAPSTSTSQSLIPALDGVRGTALLLIVLTHCCGLPFGWVGVDLFFVLSGFLITRILIKRYDQADYFKNFYKNRALRILPLYFLIITLYFGSEYIIYDKNAVSPLLFYTFLQNWKFAKADYAQTTALQHTWTVCIEEQFYLIYPFVVYFFRKKLPHVLTTIIVLVLFWRFCCVIFAFDDPYIATFCRIDALLMGGAAAYFKARLQAIKAVFVYLLLGIVVLICAPQTDFYIHTLGYTVLDLAFALMIIQCTNENNEPNNTIKRLFESAILRWLGKYSYGIYLFHWLVFYGAMVHIRPLLPDFLGVKICISLFSIAISLVLGYLSFHFLEKHFLKLKS